MYRNGITVAFKLRVLTYNIHKGYSSGNRRFMLDSMRQRIAETHADMELKLPTSTKEQRIAGRRHQFPSITVHFLERFGEEPVSGQGWTLAAMQCVRDLSYERIAGAHVVTRQTFQIRYEVAGHSLPSWLRSKDGTTRIAPNRPEQEGEFTSREIGTTGEIHKGLCGHGDPGRQRYLEKRRRWDSRTDAQRFHLRFLPFTFRVPSHCRGDPKSTVSCFCDGAGIADKSQEGRENQIRDVESEWLAGTTPVYKLDVSGSHFRGAGGLVVG